MKGDGSSSQQRDGGEEEASNAALHKENQESCFGFGGGSDTVKSVFGLVLICRLVKQRRFVKSI